MESIQVLVFGHVFDFSAMAPYCESIACIVNVCDLYNGIFHDCRLLHGKIQNAPVYFYNGEYADHFWSGNLCYQGCILQCIDFAIPNTFIPQIGKFPTIILWAVAAVIIVWFIWNKTTFGKNLYAVGGNPEAAAVSGISVFKVTMGAFIWQVSCMASAPWLECNRMVGYGSAAYGQGWDMDAIAACVVGGVSFTGGIGKISGVVTGVLIFTSLTYSLTILGIDTNLQFIFEGIIILAAVTLDCLKYVQKK